MSDTSQGPGWWYASDGKWYPPTPAVPEEPAVGTGPAGDVPPAWSPPDQVPATPTYPTYQQGPPAQPTYPQGPPTQPTYPPVPPSYGSPSGPPPWTPGVAPGTVGAPDGAPTPKSSKVPLLVAGGVVLVLLIIGGIVAATRPSSEKTAATVDSSTSSTSSTTTSTAAAGGLSSTTVAGSTSSDYTTFNDTTNNFSIATPVSWKQVSLSDPKAQSVIDKMIADNPKMATMLGKASDLASSGIKFLAANPEGNGTVNVIVQSASGAPEHPSDSDLSSAIPAITQSVESAGGTVTGHEITTVNGRKALELHYDLPIKYGSVDMTMHGTQYVFVTRDTIHIVTLLGDSDVIDKVISSFTIG